MDRLSEPLVVAIGVSGIYFFTVVMAISLSMQIADIFRQRSVRTISSTWIIYYCGMYGSGLFYSLTHHLQPMLINSIMLTLAHGVIALGILRFRGFGWRDWLLAAGVVIMLGLMAVSNHQDGWFLTFSVGGIIALAKQVRQFLSAPSTSVLNPLFLAVSVVSNLFWSGYALAIGDHALRLVCPVNLILWLILSLSWWKHRQPMVLATLQRYPRARLSSGSLEQAHLNLSEEV